MLLVGPVWGGKLASPLRTFLRGHRQELQDYAFITLCGYARPKQDDRRRIPGAILERIPRRPWRGAPILEQAHFIGERSLLIGVTSGFTGPVLALQGYNGGRPFRGGLAARASTFGQGRRGGFTRTISSPHGAPVDRRRHLATLAEGLERLELLCSAGTGPAAFTFKQRFSAPANAARRPIT